MLNKGFPLQSYNGNFRMLFNSIWIKVICYTWECVKVFWSTVDLFQHFSTTWRSWLEAIRWCCQSWVYNSVWLGCNPILSRQISIVLLYISSSRIMNNILTCQMLPCWKCFYQDFIVPIFITTHYIRLYSHLHFSVGILHFTYLACDVIYKNDTEIIKKLNRFHAACGYINKTLQKAWKDAEYI